jgi:L-malate glycosyltransferase
MDARSKRMLVGRSSATKGQTMNNAARPKILYTTADASPQSGAFNSLLYMSKEIQKRGYESLLVLPETYGKHQQGSNGYAAIYTLQLPRPKRGQTPGYYLQFVLQNSRSIIALANIVRQEQVAIVHVNEILDLYGVIAARLAQVPCVCHVRAELSSMMILQSLLPRSVAALASAIIVVSKSVDEHMFRQQGIDTKKVSLIYNPGPNVSAFHPGIDGSAVRQEFGISADSSLVVLVAKLGERKGHEILIRAAPHVLERFPNTHFMLVGGELEGAHHAEYARQIRELPCQLGVQEKVIFTGYRADVPQIMAAADVVTHCSTYPDPFPGVVLQGMSVGKPVIAPDLGGPKEQIENHVSGLLVDAGNPAALAVGICTLLSDEKQRASLGKAAAGRVRSTFTDEAFFEKLSVLYESLLAP